MNGVVRIACVGYIGVMETLTLIYALPKGETQRYMESLLSSRCKTQADIDAVTRAASADGWHSFRITTSDGSAPNFAAAINLR